ncbi:hypothetical protein P3S67_013357 [Capsicum chacoense]
MEKTFTSFLLLLHYVMVSSAMTQTNTTTDQLALLSLKSQIISDPFHFLDESWSSSTFVCHWVGVSCGSRHQRVRILNLSNMALTGVIPRDIGNLSFLVSLDLESNNFQGNLPQEMAHLSRLKFLDLSFKRFRGKVPSWFVFLHQLQVLNLRNNSFTGSIPSFSNMSTLETLNLAFNSLEGHIPVLHNMNSLGIENNQLVGSIPFPIFNISRIEFIAFTGNSLSGSLPNGLCNGLPILKGLYLSYNKLHGRIPTSLSNCSQLQILSLSYNEFDGPTHSEIGRLSCSNCISDITISQVWIIPQEIGNLVNLKELWMESNQMTGSVPISIFNISVLQVLSLWRNNLNGSLQRKIGKLTKIRFLYLNKNRFTGEIPKEIRNLVELKELNLGYNGFSGSLDIFNISGLRVVSLRNSNLSGILPPNLGSLLPNIEELHLSELTNLGGTIPHSISNCSELITLDLSYNKVIGLIPSSLRYLTHLQFLNMIENNLTSDSSLSFLTSLTNCRNLTTLSLSLNPLNSMLPVSVGNFSTLLIRFYANSCKIKGRIPNDFGNLSSLLDLDLSANSLAGSIPTTIGILKNLQRLNLSDNKLTGFIGDHICRLQHLGDIYLGQNQLSGSLPNCLGNITSLREIHLGSNKLSSNIQPSLGNVQDLVVLDLSSNNMVGSLSREIGNLKAVTKMDLPMNQISNEIPREIGGLQNLAHLSLRYNKLQVSIPDSMSNLVGLEFLDLSHNNISGNIPKSLEKLQSLKYFNVPVNRLYGEIPSGGPFKNLESQFFIYNETLCGSSRFSVPPCPTSSKHRSNRKKMLVLFLLLGIALVVVPSTFIFFWIRYRKGKRAPQQADSLSAITRERISYYELIQATDALSESNLTGSGSFGSVYKGVLRSGTAIAVKVFNLHLEAAFKSFDTECEVLCSLRHRNLVKVITSCSNLDFKALVLEYMPNGSLEKHLYSHNYFLDHQAETNHNDRCGMCFGISSPWVLIACDSL